MTIDDHTLVTITRQADVLLSVARDLVDTVLDANAAGASREQIAAGIAAGMGRVK